MAFDLQGPAFIKPPKKIDTPSKIFDAPFEKGAFERKRRSTSNHQFLGQLLVFGSARLFRLYRGNENPARSYYGVYTP